MALDHDLYEKFLSIFNQKKYRNVEGSEKFKSKDINCINYYHSNHHADTLQRKMQKIRIKILQITEEHYKVASHG